MRPDSQPTLVPRRLWLAEARTPHMRLRPDGRAVASLTRRGDRSRLSVREIDGVGGTLPAPMHLPAPGGVTSLLWSGSGSHLLALYTEGGDERQMLAVWDLATSERLDIRPAEGAEIGRIHLGQDQPERVLLWLNERDRAWPDLVGVDLRTFERQALLQNCGWADVICSAALEPRYALRLDPDGGATIAPLAAGGSSPPLRVPWLHAMTTRWVGLDRTGSTLYLIDSRLHDTGALAEVDCATGAARILFRDPRLEIAAVALHPRSLRPQAVATLGQERRWHAVDQAIREPLAALCSRFDHRFEIIDRDLADRLWLIRARPGEPGECWCLYDSPTGIVRQIAPARPRIRAAPIRPIVVAAADGLALPGFLTLPPQQPGRGPPPLVVNIHGGPWKQDHAHADPLHRWLPNRGYATLSLNYRGSTGYGAAFMNAGNGEWAGAILDDIAAAIGQTTGRGLADPGRVAVMGRSFGGYAALMLAARMEERVACAISAYGPTDLAGLFDAMPAVWLPSFAALARRVGDWRREEVRASLRSRSPLARAAAIRCPTLLAHGLRDRRVPPSQTVTLANRLAGAGAPVTCLLLPGEGHGFAAAAERLAFHAVLEAFLARFLGGALEPVEHDLDGACLTVAVDTVGLPCLAGRARTHAAEVQLRS